MIKVDQERRFSINDHKRLEQYIVDWPELARDDAVLLELLSAECETCCSLGQPPDPESLSSRFPQVAGHVDLLGIKRRVKKERRAAEHRQAAKQREQAAEEWGAPTMIGVVPSPDDESTITGIAETKIVQTNDSVEELGDLAGGTVRFGRYILIERLGQGGMGTVYRALDSTLGREVALKLPRLDLAKEPVLRERFLREARAAAAVRHVNICPIYDAGEIDGKCFITMPLVDGESLTGLIERTGLEPERAAEIVRKVARDPVVLTNCKPGRQDAGYDQSAGRHFVT
ncbi:MAG: hypothetical protein O3A00_07015 [Planctomycetota bacterium]|nr:hypothetical protein [Planctomycetota bacterium]